MVVGRTMLRVTVSMAASVDCLNATDDEAELRGLFGTGCLAGGVGPAQVLRKHDADVAADRIADERSELQGLDAATQHLELVDRLCALIARVRDARGEVVLDCSIDAEANVLGADRNLDRLARLDARRQPG